jgi:hypothetical protein
VSSQYVKSHVAEVYSKTVTNESATARLQTLNMGQPQNRPLTYRSILVHRPLVTRQGISDSLNALSDVWAEDYRAVRSMVLGMVGNNDEPHHDNKFLSLFFGEPDNPGPSS